MLWRRIFTYNTRISEENSISSLYGSDINSESLKLAEDNLGLLKNSGISKRRAELETLYQKYKKVSHTEAGIVSNQKIDTYDITGKSVSEVADYVTQWIEAKL